MYALAYRILAEINVIDDPFLLLKFGLECNRSCESLTYHRLTLVEVNGNSLNLRQLRFCEGLARFDGLM